MGVRWKDYDPTWLVELAREQHPEEPWLAEALSKCTQCFWETRAYVVFVNPERANEPGVGWQFEENIILEGRGRREFVLDKLEDGRIGGVEFLHLL